MLKASYCRHLLAFKEPATTSRSTMLDKETFFVKVWDDSCPNVFGIGEAAVFRGLSSDDTPDYEVILAEICRNIHQMDVRYIPFSSIRFGIESALLDLHNGGVRQLFDTNWSRGREKLVINGLIWMGSRDEMARRIDSKVEAGFRCVKLKIGGIAFEKELELIKLIRERYSANEIELRLDANEAFSPSEAIEKLCALAKYDIHSVEQPIKRGQWDSMAKVVEQSPVPIALDEELIGMTLNKRKREMLETIKPAYIILKPSLCGGLMEADQWIATAIAQGTGWWATSALESNVGLNAIAQWVSAKKPLMPQGLGTGALYTNNIPSPLRQAGDYITLDLDGTWDLSNLTWKS